MAVNPLFLFGRGHADPQYVGPGGVDGGEHGVVIVGAEFGLERRRVNTSDPDIRVIAGHAGGNLPQRVFGGAEEEAGTAAARIEALVEAPEHIAAGDAVVNLAAQQFRGQGGAEGEGFAEHHRKALEPFRRQHQQFPARDVPFGFLGRNLPEKPDQRSRRGGGQSFQGGAQRAVAEYPQFRRGPAPPGPGADQGFDAFFGGQPPREYGVILAVGPRNRLGMAGVEIRFDVNPGGGQAGLGHELALKVRQGDEGVHLLGPGIQRPVQRHTEGQRQRGQAAVAVATVPQGGPR